MHYNRLGPASLRIVSTSDSNRLIGWENPWKILQLQRTFSKLAKSFNVEKSPRKVLQRNCSCPQYSRTPTVCALAFDFPHLPSLQGPGPLGQIWMSRLLQSFQLNLQQLSHTQGDLLLHLTRRGKETGLVCCFKHIL